MARKIDVLNQTLLELLESNADIKAALVVSPDGLVIASQLGGISTEPDVVSAMSAAFLGLAKRAIKTLKCGDLSEVVAQGTESSLRIYACGEKAVLAIVTKSNANIGLINIDAREAAKKVIEILG